MATICNRWCKLPVGPTNWLNSAAIQTRFQTLRKNIRCMLPYQLTAAMASDSIDVIVYGLMEPTYIKSKRSFTPPVMGRSTFSDPYLSYELHYFKVYKLVSLTLFKAGTN